jgi:hypothetical protein
MKLSKLEVQFILKVSKAFSLQTSDNYAMNCDGGEVSEGRMLMNLSGFEMKRFERHEKS